MLKNMLKRIFESKLGITFLILTAIILPELLIYFSHSISTSLCILFLPAVVISAWFFAYVGVALTILQVGLFTIYILYLRGVVEPFHSFEEIQEFFFFSALQVFFLMNGFRNPVRNVLFENQER